MRNLYLRTKLKERVHHFDTSSLAYRVLNNALTVLFNCTFSR